MSDLDVDYSENPLFQILSSTVEKVISPGESLFKKVCYYCFEPFLGVEPDFINDPTWHLKLIPISMEFESRLRKSIQDYPELNNEKYGDLFRIIFNALDITAFANPALPASAKYAVAKDASKTIKGLAYIFSLDDNALVESRLNFLKKMQEEYEGDKTAESLSDFLKTIEQQTARGQSLLTNDKNIAELQRQLLLNKLLHYNSTIIPLFSDGIPEENGMVNWLGTQQSLIYMCSRLLQNKEMDRSVYRFVSERVLRKKKPLKDSRLANSYLNLINKLNKRKKADRPRDIIMVDRILLNSGFLG